MSIFYLVGFLFFGLYLLLNYYVGRRSLQTLKAFFPALSSYVYWPIFSALAAAYIANRALNINSYNLEIVGSYWLAAFCYLLLLFVFLDVFGLVISFGKILPSWVPFWQNKKIYSLGIISTIVILLIGSWVASHPILDQYQLEIAKETADLESLKIIMISDLHLEPHENTSLLEDAAERITSLDPDLIFLVGDLVEGSVDPLTQEKLNKIIAKLQAKQGIYAVLGNHEYYGQEADQITEFLEKQGIEVLRDEVESILGDQIYLVGRNDYRSKDFGQGRQSLNELLKDIPPSKPVILLDHQPQTASEAQESGRVDLMLSGHTHGGQLFPGQFFTKALFVIDRGLWQKDDFNLIVSTGLGVWGPPVRTSSQSEIVEINLTFTD